MKTASVPERLNSTNSMFSSPVVFSKYIVRISSDVSGGMFCTPVKEYCNEYVKTRIFLIS